MTVHATRKEKAPQCGVYDRRFSPSKRNKKTYEDFFGIFMIFGKKNLREMMPEEIPACSPFPARSPFPTRRLSRNFFPRDAATLFPPDAGSPTYDDTRNACLHHIDEWELATYLSQVTYQRTKGMTYGIIRILGTERNGVSERQNRILLEMVRSMMSLTDLPLKESMKIESICARPYASAIGSIMYAMLCTRPDVSPAIKIFCFACPNRSCGDRGLLHCASIALQTEISIRKVVNFGIHHRLRVPRLSLTQALYLCTLLCDSQIVSWFLCWYKLLHIGCSRSGSPCFESIYQPPAGSLVQRLQVQLHTPSGRVEVLGMRRGGRWRGGVAPARGGSPARVGKAVRCGRVGGGGLPSQIIKVVHLVFETIHNTNVMHVFGTHAHSGGGPSDNPSCVISDAPIRGPTWFITLNCTERGLTKVDSFCVVSSSPPYTRNISLVLFRYFRIFLTVYLKRENTGSWNSGLEKEKSESSILHNSNCPENQRGIFWEYIKNTGRKKYQRGATRAPQAW
ncbi:hypothetical protein ZWY2020_006987 [Hordeum vulgare]|nr:hypothetical protein ZWY2020_006987 [Hordeum vulgare]